ncbi:MAG: hypothetical protein Ct9H300mP25_11100 [Acidobacteriota bacterium]|nr:MAG: hypothetical protein Ct9H300mP25_11100 [Acidobacteriota bacterium]
MGLRANTGYPLAVRHGRVGLHQPRMPVNREGTLTADQVYALTAYLLYLNDVISEDDVVDDQNLAKIEMPNRKTLPTCRIGNAGCNGFQATLSRHMERAIVRCDRRQTPS